MASLGRDMTRNQELWDQANHLLVNREYFESERDRVLEALPLLNSQGLGFVPNQHRGRQILSVEKLKTLNSHERHEFEISRDSLRKGGECVQGIRNTLEYFAEGRIAVSYRLQGCSRQKRINGMLPQKCSSYVLKHRAESFLLDNDKRFSETASRAKVNRCVANGAFLCASLMVGIKLTTYRNSIHPDLRIGRPWAVAGLLSENYVQPRKEHMSRFWRWVAQNDSNDPSIDAFTRSTIDLLYSGASLEELESALDQSDELTQRVHLNLMTEFESIHGRVMDQKSKVSKRIGMFDGKFQVPYDFDEMYSEEIARMFYQST